MCSPQTRIDLTDYRPYLELLRDKLNEDGVYRMSLTDVVKILIEQKMAAILPDVVVNKTRKRYIQINF